MTRCVSDLIGDIKGYRRGAIRREVGQNVLRSDDEVKADAERLLGSRIAAALRDCPLYAEKVRANCDGVPDPASVSLAELPVWTKDDLRKLWDHVHDAPPPGGIGHSTGGSTGSPSKFFITRDSYEWRMAVSDRGYGWAGAAEGQRSYYVWGVSITPSSQLHRVKAGLEHWLQNRKYFDSFDFAEARKAECCREIEAFKPKAIVGYAGNLVDLALYVHRNPSALKWRSESIVTAADGLRPGQRELIEQTLGEAVFLTYGSREFMLIGAECPEHRGYHLSTDNLWVEVVDDSGQPVPPGESGRILVTDLHNMATPFIRYEIGDVGVMAADPCPCGLPFPLLERVEGRIQERIELPGGESLTALFIPHLMKEFEWAKAYQVRQISDSEICMELITDEPLQAEKTGEIVRYLQPRVGEAMSITCRRVDSLQKSASGKTPIVVGEKAET
ncbi:MAG: hypothetical protein QGH42_03050 [Kiritimatiellia bacterium]|nr:hypothetical protein [Kiritimatiellia bacterium]